MRQEIALYIFSTMRIREIIILRKRDGNMNLEVNNRFTEMTVNETMTTDGGKGLGWIGLLQPAYDFICGVVDGFKKPCRKCK
jgi:hypothetical protein